MIKKKQTTIDNRTLKTEPRAVVRQAVTAKAGTEKTPSDMQGIKFLAVGVSKKGGKFLLVAKGDQRVVLSVRNLGRDPNTELERLEMLDVHLLVQPTRQAFLRRAQEAAKMKPRSIRFSPAPTSPP
jgi:hypothetical protein